MADDLRSKLQANWSRLKEELSASSQMIADQALQNNILDFAGFGEIHEKTPVEKVQFILLKVVKQNKCELLFDILERNGYRQLCKDVRDTVIGNESTRGNTFLIHKQKETAHVVENQIGIAMEDLSSTLVEKLDTIKEDLSANINEKLDTIKEDLSANMNEKLDTHLEKSNEQMRLELDRRDDMLNEHMRLESGKREAQMEEIKTLLHEENIKHTTLSHEENIKYTTLQSSYEKARKKIEYLTKLSQSKTLENCKISKQLEDMQNELKFKEQELENLRKKFEAKESEMKSLSQRKALENSKLSKQIEEMQKEMAFKKQEQENLKKKIEAKKPEIESLRKQIVKSESDKEVIAKELNEKTKELEHVRKQMEMELENQYKNKNTHTKSTFMTKPSTSGGTKPRPPDNKKRVVKQITNKVLNDEVKTNSVQRYNRNESRIK